MTEEKNRDFSPQPSPQAIAASLGPIDAIYKTYSTAALTDPDHTASHAKPLQEAAENFSKLTSLLDTGNPLKKAQIISILRTLLDDRKEAYTEELHRTMGRIHQHAGNNATPMMRVNSLASKEEMQAYIENQKTLPTPNIIAEIRHYKDIAKESNLALSEGNLGATLARITAAAAEAEKRLRVKEGAIQAFIQLDHSGFLATVAAAENGQKIAGHVADLADGATFKKRFAKTIMAVAEGADVAWAHSLKAVDNRSNHGLH